MSTAALTKPDPDSDSVAAAPEPARSCWGVTDGSAGTMAQVKALAEALGLKPVMKRVKIKPYYAWLPNAFYNGKAWRRLKNAPGHFSDDLSPPWPEIVISCGRRGALAALALKARGASARLVHIHDPQMKPKHFDLIVAMAHDKAAGDNVIKTHFAMHNITKELLADAAKKFAKRFSLYPKPYVALLFGGSTNKYTLKEKRMHDVITELQRLVNNISGSLLMTTSRRTGGDNLRLLLDAFPRARESRTYIYDGIGENPYLGMLALADHIVVTDDSVNMMSEAVATGKPVYILKLPGHENTKPARFAEKLIKEGIARPLESKLESWSYTAENETAKVAAEIRRRLAW